jgi:peptidyl-tRNA hydrolase
MKNTLKGLQEKIDALKRDAKLYTNQVRDRVAARPYFYETFKDEDGKKVVTVVNVTELYAHVQTAKALGYETQVEADNGKLQIVFLRKLPPTPFSLMY